MERYKKRTIALCLASLLTVVGAFGTDNYTNTLMALKVNAGSKGRVNLTAFTKRPYSTKIKTNQVDDNTFVFTLNDTNSSAVVPDIENYENIDSIKISTYPYTTESDGCTRIVIKTIGEPVVSASHALFIPSSSTQTKAIEQKTEVKSETNNSYWGSTTSHVSEEYTPETVKYSPKTISNDETTKSENISEDVNQAFIPPDYTNTNTSRGSFEYMTVLLCISVLMALIGFVYIFSKDRMANVVGDQGDFDVDNTDSKKGNKPTKIKKISTKINELDKSYSTKTSSYNTNHNKSDEVEDSAHSEENENKEQNVVVDLDVLYQEAQKTDNTEDEEDDLAMFLNAFTFEQTPEEPEEVSFDEEFYNKVINSNKLRFSEKDVKKINQLLQTEISQEMADNLYDYRKSPSNKPPTKEQILEELLSTYSIKQDIDFTQEDVDAIKKLMNVELDADFVKDFTTNPVRTKIVENEIKEHSGQKPHITSEILTLNVKNMLPDLSQELKKQGNKAIKSEAKPTVVYFSEGYEYEKLQVSSELSNISEKLKSDKSSNEYKPSYQVPIVDSGYEVSTLAIKDALPDLADVKAHPDKYKDKKPEKPKASEEALLKSIANVTFKPFYEDVENELNKFDNFEIINPDEQSQEIQEEKEAIAYTESPSVVSVEKNNRDDENAKKLLELIEIQRAKRKNKQNAEEEMALFKKELISASAKKIKKIQTNEEPTEFYNYNGEKFKVLKTLKCTKNSECKLIQADDKYIIIGSVANKEIVLKQYNSLNNPELHVRRNDKNSKTQFLFRIGMHKFIVKITDDNMEFVMDLC